MGDDDLEVLITLDDPVETDEEDFFNHQAVEQGTGTILLVKGCSHLSEIRNVDPNTTNGCEGCLTVGDEWVHLRVCDTCGHVGCCNNSKNKHSTRHFLETNHPIIRSLEPGEYWAWCFMDDLRFEF